MEELKKEAADTLGKNGRVYGIYEKKELVGIYIFERIENYFFKSGSGVKLGDKEFDFNEFWFGDSTAALHFKKCVCLEEVEAYKEKLEKDLKADLMNYIGIGQAAGVEWNDKLMYRKNLQKQKRTKEDLLKWLGWVIIGFVMGWTLFHTFYMAFFLGCMWGSVVYAGVVEESTPVDTLDLVRKREV